MHGFIIHLVHYDNHVETVEILLDDSAGMMGQRIAASLSSNPHPSIRQIAGMTTICSGRINLQRDSYARFFSQTAQYGLGRRRTANIAETNKRTRVFITTKITIFTSDSGSSAFSPEILLFS